MFSTTKPALARSRATGSKASRLPPIHPPPRGQHDTREDFIVARAKPAQLEFPLIELRVSHTALKLKVSTDRRPERDKRQNIEKHSHKPLPHILQNPALGS